MCCGIENIRDPSKSQSRGTTTVFCGLSPPYLCVCGDGGSEGRCLAEALPRFSFKNEAYEEGALANEMENIKQHC